MTSALFSHLSFDDDSHIWNLGSVLAVMAGLVLSLALSPVSVQAQIGNQQKISDTAGGFGGTLADNDKFGGSTVEIGDLDGDGQTNLAIGASKDDDGCQNCGAVWIVDLKADGTVASEQKISDTAGNFGGTLLNDNFGGSRFGTGLAHLGDIDSDGQTNIAVGAQGGEDGDHNQGEVWILDLKSDGTVDTEQKISETAGSFGGTLDRGERFGHSVAHLGDIDNDGKTNLAVGAVRNEGGGNNRGGVWILDLNADGTVADEQEITDTNGGFTGTLNDDDLLGSSVSRIGDLSGDGIPELAVGAIHDDDGGGSSSDRGAVWILYLNGDGTVASHQKISDTAGGFGGGLDDSDKFGAEAARIGDLNDDTVPDLAVGAHLDDDGGGSSSDRGAVWILYLNGDGTVASHEKISDTSGGFGGTLNDGDNFGSAVTRLGDIDGDNIVDLASGATKDNGSGTDRGAVWVLFGEQALLPVELAVFEGARVEEGIRLRWRTASETNNAAFRVQRRIADASTPGGRRVADASTSGLRVGERDGWMQVGSVEGTGTADQPQSYRFTDEKLPYEADRLEYRLKQVDTDGTTHLTDPVVVERGAVETLQLKKTFPNPVQDQVTVRFAIPERTEKEGATLRLYDVLGRPVRTVRAEAMPGRHEVQLEVSDLASGVYVLRLGVGETVQTRRLTVVR